MLAPQPMPAAKNASFAATETLGQKTTENMTAKIMNMIAVNMGPRRRMLSNSLQIIECLLLALFMDSLI
ncbi:MAG: hypothetical protein V1694_02860 [Candidatus Eisenbacteria bacterium]